MTPGERLRYSRAPTPRSEPYITSRRTLAAALLLPLGGVCAWVGCAASLSQGGTESPSAGASAVQVDIIVPKAPPPDKDKPGSPAAPAFGYIWIAGHWDWVEGIYIWKGGRWMQGRAGYEYARARYEFDATQKSWVYHRPHWKRRGVSVAPAPPALAPAPVAPTTPSPDAMPRGAVDGGAG